VSTFVRFSDDCWFFFLIIILFAFFVLVVIVVRVLRRQAYDGDFCWTSEIMAASRDFLEPDVSALSLVRGKAENPSRIFDDDPESLFGSKICFDKGGGLGNFELDQSYFRCRNVICCRNGSLRKGGRFVPVTNSKGRHLSGLIFFRHPPSRSTVLAMSTFGGKADIGWTMPNVRF